MTSRNMHGTRRRRATLTIRQAAWMLDVPTATVYRLIRIGAIGTVNRKHGVVVPESDIVRLMPGGAA